MTPTVIRAAGLRLPWSRVPSAVRAAVDERLGSPVVAAEDQPGGFSPGAAARLTLADGRRVFAKSVGPEPNEHSPVFHRREARIAAALPASVPAPRLQFSLDDGAWVTLVFEDVAGGVHPTLPWRVEDLRLVLDAAYRLSTEHEPPPVALPGVVEQLEEDFTGWRRLAGSGGGDPGTDTRWLDPWARERLPRLAAWEQAWADAAAGAALLHLDLREDNLLLVGERVVFVDWPHASTGAWWIDVLALGPSAIMQTGGHVIDELDRHLAGRGAPVEAVTTVFVAVCGFFAWTGSRPAPPGLPGAPAFQRAQGAAALQWLRRRAPHL